VAALLVLTACPAHDPNRLPEDPELRELAVLLRSLAAGGPEEAAQAVVEDAGSKILALLRPVEEGLAPLRLSLERLRVEGSLFFELALSTAEDRQLGLHLFYRADLPGSVARAFGEEDVLGFPAQSYADEHLFVLAGRFEIRAFQTSEQMRDQARLHEVVNLLPLAELAQL